MQPSRKKLAVLCLFFFTFSLLLTACEQNRIYKATDAPADDGDNDFEQKPTPAPHYDPNQFKAGQFWIWKEHKKEAPRCFKWEIEKITNAGVYIKHRSSTECPHFDDEYTTIVFNRHDGKIIKNTTDDFDFGDQESIFPIFYGSDKAVKLRQRAFKDHLGKIILNVFNVEKSESWYVDMPNTSLHGVLYSDKQLTLLDAGSVVAQ